MRKKLLGLKEELKQLAKNIRRARNKFKDNQRKFSKNIIGYDDLFDGSLRELYKCKYEFRHKHIVYCQLRGRRREQIEVPREDNRPNETYIEELTKAYEETLCASA